LPILPGGALISLSKLPPAIAVDAEAMTVSVTGGTRYGVLAAQLQSQGYALHNTGSLPHISVAGATATGTHGSGDRNGILSTAVSAVELVKADGSLVTVEAGPPGPHQGGHDSSPRGRSQAGLAVAL
jgi:xylitol oxidase